MAESNLARALLAPRCVALVGASADPSKNTARPQRFLRKHGYTGKVFPVNPSRDQVLGLPCYRSLADTPPVDHVFIMIEDVEAAYKLSQNRSAADYSNIVHELRKTGNETDRALASEMERIDNKRNQ